MPSRHQGMGQPEGTATHSRIDELIQITSGPPIRVHEMAMRIRSVGSCGAVKIPSYELPITRKSPWPFGASAVVLPTAALGLAFLNRNFVSLALIVSGVGVVWDWWFCVHHDAVSL